MRKCFVCGSDQKKVLYDATVRVPDPYPLNGVQTIVRCPICNMIYSDSSNSVQAFAEYYTKLNKHKKRASDASRLDQAYFRHVIQFIGKIPASSRILDFGSGDLLLKSMFEEVGYGHVDVCDVDLKASDAARYDLIISTHTFEHIVNADTVLQQLVVMLRKGGTMLLAVPDIDGYLKQYYGPFNAFDLEHINHFNADSLCRFVSNHGMTVEKYRCGKREVRPNLFYPEIMLLSHKNGRSREKVHQMDFSAESISAYIEQSQDDFNRAMQVLAEKSDKHLIFWGIGIYMMRLAHHLPEMTGTFVDGDSRLWGKQINGHPIVSPDDIDADALMDEEFVVAAVNANDIVHAIRQRFGSDVSVSVL